MMPMGMAAALRIRILKDIIYDTMMIFLLEITNGIKLLKVELEDDMMIFIDFPLGNNRVKPTNGMVSPKVTPFGGIKSPVHNKGTC